MAGVAQLVELWIVIPIPPSNISDLTPKSMQANAGKALECRQNTDKQKGETRKNLKAKREFTLRVSDCEEKGENSGMIDNYMDTMA